MGRFYSINYTPANPAAVDVTMVSILASASRGFKVHRVVLTSADTAGATVVEARAYQITTQGTGTANVANPEARDDTAFTGTVKVNCSAEPSKGNIIGRRQWNLITPYEWLAMDKEWEIEAGVGHGFAIFLHDNPAAVVHAEIFIEER